MPVVEPGHVVDNDDGAGLDATVIAINGLVAADRGITEADGLLLGHEEFDVLAKTALIGFQGQDVIGLLVDDLLRDLALAPHSVDGDDRAVDGQQVKQLRNGDDFIGFFGYLDLTEHETLTRGEGRYHVDRRLAFVFETGPARRLAVDRDDALRYSGDRCDPGCEAALELSGVQHGQDVAEMIVRRRAVTERTEAAEQVQLLHAKDGYLGDGLRPGQYREQAEKKDLLQRIAHLSLLPGVAEMLEAAQKTDCPAVPGAFGRGVVHGELPQSESIEAVSNQHPSGLSRTPSPDCPAAEPPESCFRFPLRASTERFVSWARRAA